MSEFKPRRPAPPPPNMPSATVLRQYFDRVDTNKSGTITASELQDALSNGNGSKFNIQTVNSMIGMFDQKKNGEIDFDNFGSLWRYIVDWQNCFKTFDKDKSGSINKAELTEALGTFGYNLSGSIMQLLINKFDRTNSDAVSFDDFIQACLALHSLTDIFRAEDKDMDGVITISYETFLNMLLNSTIIK